MFAKWRHDFAEDRSANSYWALWCGTMEHPFWSTSRFDLSSFRFKGYLKGFMLQNHLTFWCFVGRCFWVTWDYSVCFTWSLQGTETISLLNKCQCVQSCVQIKLIYIIIKIIEKLYNKHGSSKVEYWVDLGTIQNFSKTSTVRCRDYSSPGVQGNGTTKHLRSKWNGLGMLLNWLLLICVMDFWWFLMIFEYCKCYTFARIICGVCLYRLCIDMKHFSLFVMYGMMGSGHIDEAITSWWYQQNVIRAEFDNNDVPCPLFFLTKPGITRSLLTSVGEAFLRTPHWHLCTVGILWRSWVEV